MSDAKPRNYKVTMDRSDHIKIKNIYIYIGIVSKVKGQKRLGDICSKHNRKRWCPQYIKSWKKSVRKNFKNWKFDKAEKSKTRKKKIVNFINNQGNILKNNFCIQIDKNEKDE